MQFEKTDKENWLEFWSQSLIFPENNNNNNNNNKQISCTSCLGSSFFFLSFFVLWLGNFMYKSSVNFHKKNVKLDIIYPIYKWKKLRHIEFLSDLTDKAWISDKLVQGSVY